MSRFSLIAPLFALPLIISLGCDAGMEDADFAPSADAGTIEEPADEPNEATAECEFASFGDGVLEGYFYTDSEGAHVELGLFVNDGFNYDGLVIDITSSALVTLGPGSYPLTEEDSFGNCNPCVVGLHGTNTGDGPSLIALAVTGTLQIEELMPEVGGHISASITGLTLKQATEEGPGACEVSIPDLSFSTTLEEPAQ